MEALRRLRKHLHADLCVADSCHRTRTRHLFCGHHDWDNCTAKRSRILGENTDLNNHREIRED